MTHTTHELKTTPEFFRQIWQGRKRAELRLNDRDFKRNDCLHIQEYDPTTDSYSGDYIIAIITEVTDYPRALRDGYVMLNFETAVCVEKDLEGQKRIKELELQIKGLNDYVAEQDSNARVAIQQAKEKA